MQNRQLAKVVKKRIGQLSFTELLQLKHNTFYRKAYFIKWSLRFIYDNRIGFIWSRS